MISDPRFWAQDLCRNVVGGIRRFRHAAQDKILPAFANLAQEADEVANRTYEQLGRSFNPDYDDPASHAERAHEASIEYYVEMKNIEQAVLNMQAAALYHLLEQKLLEFHRLEFLHGVVKGNRKLQDVYASLEAEGVYVQKLPSAPKIEELRLVANTVKHGEGESSRKLRTVRPDLFIHPHDRSGPYAVVYGAPVVYVPLLGEQFYVSPSDLNAYFDTVERFLNELAEALESLARQDVSRSGL